MNDLHPDVRSENGLSRRRVLNHVALFGIFFWIFTYLTLTIEAELDPGNAPFISERRLLLTCIGAAIYVGALASLAPRTRRQRALRNLLLLFSAMPAALALLSFQLLFDPDALSNLYAEESIEGTLVFAGSFIAGIVAWILLHSGLKRYVGVPLADDLQGARGGGAAFGNLARRYSADNAEAYELRRLGQKWTSENLAVERLLARVPEGSRILDVPVGTGRFFPWFKARNFDTVGLDASPDMIVQAKANADRLGMPVRLEKGDILAIGAEGGTYDLVVCIRFLNLIDWAGVDAALRELARVSNRHVIIGIRCFTPISCLQCDLGGLVRLSMRLLGVPQLLARRRELVFHDPQSLAALYDSLGLRLLDAELVERRWDGTDYAILMLEKGA